jgi:dTDP-4-dehydrorhamnose 3,5-epimerase-like enzyme
MCASLQTCPTVLIIEPDVYYGGRGFFLETYQGDRYRMPAASSRHSSRTITRNLRIRRPQPNGSGRLQVHGLLPPGRRRLNLFM